MKAKKHSMSTSGNERDTQLMELTVTEEEKHALALRAQSNPKTGEPYSYAEIAEIINKDKPRGARRTRQAMYEMVKRAERKMSRIDAPTRFAKHPENCPIEQAPLPSRVRNSLIKKGGYTRLGQLVGLSKDELRDISGLGRQGAMQVVALLELMQVKKPQSYCPACGSAMNRKLKDGRTISCDKCGHTTEVRVVAQPEPEAVSA